MVAVMIECKLQKTIRRSKSRHHLHVNKLDRRKVAFKVLRLETMPFYPLESQRVEGWLVVQPPAQRVLLYSQQQEATRCGGESAEHGLRIV